MPLLHIAPATDSLLGGTPVKKAVPWGTCWSERVHVCIHICLHPWPYLIPHLSEPTPTPKSRAPKNGDTLRFSQSPRAKSSGVGSTNL